MSDTTDQEHSPEDLEAARGQVQPPPVATGPDHAAVAARMATASPDETDVKALLRQMQAQQAAMAAEIARLKAGQAPAGLHPLIGTAQSARDLLAVHFDHNPKPSAGEVLRLADDTVDAAKHAVESGDVSRVRDLGGRLERAARRAHPGSGEHHYYAQALDFIAGHLPRAADTVTGPAPSDAPAVGSDRGSVPVIAGSVTG